MYWNCPSNKNIVTAKKLNNEQVGDEKLSDRYRTNKIKFSRPRKPAAKIPYSLTKKPCMVKPVEDMVVDSSKGCPGRIQLPTSKMPSTATKCVFSGDEQAFVQRTPIRLIPETGGGWTRTDNFDEFLEKENQANQDSNVGLVYNDDDVTQGLPDDHQLSASPIKLTCSCAKPYCPKCWNFEPEAQSEEIIVIEKNISCDEDISGLVDSFMIPNPMVHRKVLQFENAQHREKYKKDILAKLKTIANTVPRAEWISHLEDFDRFASVIMAESSTESETESTTDLEVRIQKEMERKQRKRAKQMLSVLDMRHNSYYFTKYLRQYTHLMEELKRQSAAPINSRWPRFMKIFSGYGREPGVEDDPEWLGLYLMSRTSRFKEISSCSSSLESLPHLSDPGSDSASSSSEVCSPSACAIDSVENIKNIGICADEKTVVENNYEATCVNADIAPKETSLANSISVVNSIPNADPLSSVSMKMTKSVNIDVSLLSSSQPLKTTVGSSIQFKSQGILRQSTSITKSNVDLINSQASQFFNAFRKRSTFRRATLNRAQLKKALLALESEIIVIQEELKRPPLVNQEIFGEWEEFYGEVVQEDQLTQKNVVLLIRGKPYKMSYECYCKEKCSCDPAILKEKYVDTLIDAIYKIRRGLADEESEIDEANELTDGDQSRTEDISQILLDYHSSSKKLEPIKSVESDKQQVQDDSTLQPASSILSDFLDSDSSDGYIPVKPVQEESVSSNVGKSKKKLCSCCQCEDLHGGSLTSGVCIVNVCNCCSCQKKLKKAAQKRRSRKKASRFFYILLKKIRQAVDKPSEEERQLSLQGLVNNLRLEAKRFPRKKWPNYFKRIMVGVGLESPSDSTSISESEKDEEKGKKKKDERWRYRKSQKYKEIFTAADIQKREWLEWRAKTMGEVKPATSYTTPQRAVFQIDDMQRWMKSEAYYEYFGFITTINEAIKGKSCKLKLDHSTNVQAILSILDRLSTWIDEIPPIQQPQRFGNKAFRNWVARLIQEGPTNLVELLPSQFHGGLGESQAYLLEAFGNTTRIDYGTGHEMAFLMFLCCLFKIGVFNQDDQLSVALTIFPRYLHVVRKLQTVYKMEPAGSRGVWALDDFQFIPFLWGSSQLIGHQHIRPSSFLKEDIILGFHDHYMFLACIKYINENKIGPFAEHSNQLWNISALPNWDKVNSGLVKMYKGEVLSKFPVVQHVLFGSILPITPPPPSQNERPYSGLVRDGLSPSSREPLCEQLPAPPSVPPRRGSDDGATSVISSLSNLSEKFQNVPNAGSDVV